MVKPWKERGSNILNRESVYDLATVEETQKIGFILGKLVFGSSVILCQGDLGAGKTSLAQGVAKGMGINEEITSPTFVIIKEYTSGNLPFYHMDLYRMENPEAIYELGFDDYLYGQGVTFIEWAEKTPNLLMPKEYLLVQITFCGTGRQIKLRAHGALYEDMLKEMPKCI